MLPNNWLDRRIRTAAPKQALTILFHALHSLEDERQITCSTAVPLNPLPEPHGTTTDVFSTIALPTHQAWTAAVQQDNDLRKIIQALNREAPIPLRSDLNEPVLLDALQQHQLESENGILYYFDHSKAREIRQLRRRVVPKQLRPLVFLACHSSPFAGHSGITRTLYRLQTRFWWPGMVRDATEGVRGCLHCNLGNTTNHETQTQINTNTSSSPFATVYMDVWSPGDLPDKHGNTKVLTMMDCLTGFVIIAFLRFKVNALIVTQAIMESLVCTVGLPSMW